MKKPFIPGEQGNKSLKLKEAGEPRQLWGTGNIKNQNFDSGEQRKMFVYFRGTRVMHPPGKASLVPKPTFKSRNEGLKPRCEVQAYV